MVTDNDIREICMQVAYELGFTEGEFMEPANRNPYCPDTQPDLWASWDDGWSDANSLPRR